MTVSSAQNEQRKKPRNRAPLRREAMIALARFVLFWERAWPAAIYALAAPFLLVIASLFNIWAYLPIWAHWIALAATAIAVAWFALTDLAPLRFPSRRDALRRLEEDGRVPHAPLQALEDAPFSGDDASPLWRAHMKASADRARAARLGGVRSAADQRDPYALRFTAVGVLAVALVAAGGEWRSQLAAGFSPQELGVRGPVIADLWIEPPDYAGRAPIYLLRAGEEKTGVAEQINAPQYSTLVAHVNGRGRIRLSFATPLEQTDIELERRGAAARGTFTLEESGLLALNYGGKKLRWPLGVIPDRAPAVGFVEAPTATEDGKLALHLSTDDDYGIAEGALELRLDPDQPRPLDAPGFDEASLAEVRRIDLPTLAGPPGAAKDALDLQADPWAGLTVIARAVVADGAGQIAYSPEERLTLPARSFFNPLAKAVIEQRQTLATAPDHWRRAGRSFDAMTMAPEVFFERSTQYLLLRAAFWRVMRETAGDYSDAVASFWPLALQLEDEALELARQRLEAAQEALREALERGASDDEIERLVEELRAAMDNYLQALAQSGQAGEQAGAGAEQLSQSDLDEMLNSIRDLAQSGAANAARQMLSDLENLLNNLRLTQGSGGGARGAPGEGQGDDSPSGRAGEIIGQQRELADETYERARRYDDNGDDLAEREGDLGQSLEGLMDDLEGMAEEDANGDAAREFGQARSDMREAQEALENGDLDAAASAMERAIDNLRDGAEGLARERMAREGESGERGGRVDPLGRPVGDPAGGGVDVPEETEAGRTRAVIDELRRRLGEPGRSQEEIDYLERLLERF